MRKDLQKETVDRVRKCLNSGTALLTDSHTTSNPYYRERMVRHKVNRTMSVPFSRRTGKNCFLGVDNSW